MLSIHSELGDAANFSIFLSFVAGSSLIILAGTGGGPRIRVIYNVRSLL
jgi:hypothetical protein